MICEDAPEIRAAVPCGIIAPWSPCAAYWVDFSTHDPITATRPINVKSKKSPSRLRTQAWLLRGIHSMPGVLMLSGGRLSFTASGAGNLSRSRLRKLESDAGRTGLARLLGDGEDAIVFEVPLADVQDVTFPWYYFAGGVKLTAQGVRYRFGFDRPSNTKLSGEGGDVVGEVSRARRSGKAWKAVLLPS